MTTTAAAADASLAEMPAMPEIECYQTPDGKILQDYLAAMDIYAPEDVWKLAKMHHDANDALRTKNSSRLLDLLKEARRARESPHFPKRAGGSEAKPKAKAAGKSMAKAGGGNNEEEDDECAPFDLSNYELGDDPRGENAVETLGNTATDGYDATTKRRQACEKTMNDAHREALEQSAQELEATVAAEKGRRTEHLTKIGEGNKLVAELFTGLKTREFVAQERVRVATKKPPPAEGILTLEKAMKDVEDEPSASLEKAMKEAKKCRIDERNEAVTDAGTVLLVSRPVKPKQLEIVTGQETESAETEMLEQEKAADKMLGGVDAIGNERTSYLTTLRERQEAAGKYFGKAGKAVKKQKGLVTDAYAVMRDEWWAQMEKTIVHSLMEIRVGELEAKEKTTVEEDTTTAKTAIGAKEAGNKWKAAAKDGYGALVALKQERAKGIVKHFEPCLKEVEQTVVVMKSLLGLAHKEAKSHVDRFDEVKKAIGTRRAKAQQAADEDALDEWDLSAEMRTCNDMEADAEREAKPYETQLEKVKGLQEHAKKACMDFQALKAFTYEPSAACYDTDEVQTATDATNRSTEQITAEEYFTVHMAPKRKPPPQFDEGTRDDGRAEDVATGSASSDQTAIARNLTMADLVRKAATRPGADPFMVEVMQSLLQQVSEMSEEMRYMKEMFNPDVDTRSEATTAEYNKVEFGQGGAAP